MRPVPLSEEELREQIAEARQLSVGAPIIMPMLERRKHLAFQRLMSAHRDGRPAEQNAIAEIFVIETMQQEIRAKLEALNFTEG